jgi:imidazole glycerol phosphate synthase subunit HisF
MPRERSADRSLMVLSASNGCLLISDTAAHVGQFIAFQTVGSTVINTVSQLDATLNTTAAKADITGKTLTDGKFIYAGAGNGDQCVFTSIQLTSGAVIAYYA